MYARTDNIMVPYIPGGSTSSQVIGAGRMRYSICTKDETTQSPVVSHLRQYPEKFKGAILNPKSKHHNMHLPPIVLKALYDEVFSGPLDEKTKAHAEECKSAIAELSFCAKELGIVPQVVKQVEEVKLQPEVVDAFWESIET